MNFLTSAVNFIWNDGTKDVLTLPTRTTAKKNIYNFRCPKDNTTAQLVVSKTETDKQAYSVFIRFLGMVEEQHKWEILIRKDDQIRPSYEMINYSGGRAFSFKIVDGNYVKIKEYDENGSEIRYVDLLSRIPTLIAKLPPPSIQKLIKIAREFPTGYTKEVFFNDSVVVMVLHEFSIEKRIHNRLIYVGDTNSSELVQCHAKQCSGAQLGMLGLTVEFKGNKYLLELKPIVCTAHAPPADICWDHNKLYNA